MAVELDGADDIGKAVPNNTSAVVADGSCANVEATRSEPGGRAECFPSSEFGEFELSGIGKDAAGHQQARPRPLYRQASEQPRAVSVPEAGWPLEHSGGGQRPTVQALRLANRRGRLKTSLSVHVLPLVRWSDL